MSKEKIANRLTGSVRTLRTFLVALVPTFFFISPCLADSALQGMTFKLNQPLTQQPFEKRIELQFANSATPSRIDDVLDMAGEAQREKFLDLVDGKENVQAIKKTTCWILLPQSKQAQILAEGTLLQLDGYDSVNIYKPSTPKGEGNRQNYKQIYKSNFHCEAQLEVYPTKEIDPISRLPDQKPKNVKKFGPTWNETNHLTASFVLEFESGLGSSWHISPTEEDVYLLLLGVSGLSSPPKVEESVASAPEPTKGVGISFRKKQLTQDGAVYISPRATYAGASYILAQGSRNGACLILGHGRDANRTNWSNERLPKGNEKGQRQAYITDDGDFDVLGKIGAEEYLITDLDCVD